MQSEDFWIFAVQYSCAANCLDAKRYIDHCINVGSFETYTVLKQYTATSLETWIEIFQLTIEKIKKSSLCKASFGDSFTVGGITFEAKNAGSFKILYFLCRGFGEAISAILFLWGVFESLLTLEGSLLEVIEKFMCRKTQYCYSFMSLYVIEVEVKKITKTVGIYCTDRKVEKVIPHWVIIWHGKPNNAINASFEPVRSKQRSNVQEAIMWTNP